MMSDFIDAPPFAADERFSDCRWLVFDAVGTLIDPNPSVAVAYHSVGMRFGARSGVAEVGQRFRTAFRASERHGITGDSPASLPWATSHVIELERWRWIVREVFPDVQNHEACFRELWDHFARPSSWFCFDDVGPSLTRLSQAGYRLAIASNFDIRLHSVCDGLAELAPIEHRIVSAAVGFRKPAPEFFAELVRVCETDPRQILMIGDNFEYDVLAPRRAGLQALHLDRNPEVGDSRRLRSLLDLIAMLSRNEPV